MRIATFNPHCLLPVFLSVASRRLPFYTGLI